MLENGCCASERDAEANAINAAAAATKPARKDFMVDSFPAKSPPTIILYVVPGQASSPQMWFNLVPGQL
jgi:uncharacterized membrane protein YdjX (TVP38/TMEM64 family)